MDLVETNEIQSVPVIALSSALGAVILLLYLVFGWSKRSTDIPDEKIVDDSSNSSLSSNKKHSKVRPKQHKSSQKSLKRPFSHPHLHTTLKGHTGVVTKLDLSINGKYLASCSEDRSMMLWSVKEFGITNKSVMVNVKYDHGNHIKFSPDSKAVLLGLHYGNTVRIFKLDKKDDGITPTFTPLEKDFDKYTNKADLLDVGIGLNAFGGSFVMTAYNDTTILVQDLKGEILHTINTNQGNNICALVSPCGRFIASGGWTPDVKVWAVVFDRSGSFQTVKRAFELKGHNASVWSFDFNNDSTRMVTVSKDGRWRLYDTQIEYEKGQEPYLLHSGLLDMTDFSIKDHPAVVALSPDGRVAALACVTSVVLFSTLTGKKEVEIQDVHTEVITDVKFDIAGRYFLTSGDRHIRVFYNTLGYKETIRDLEIKLRKPDMSSTTLERLEKQRDDAKKALDEIERRANLTKK